MQLVNHIPYCGAPPVPGGATWNLDPVLLAVLILGAALYAAGARRAGLERRQIWAFAAGWGLLSLALVSPLCNLSVALFTARILQHMLIVLVAAPLLVLGGVDTMLWRLWNGARTPGGMETAIAAGAFAAAIWLWHTPAAYDATFRSDVIYWTMHVTMAASALALWHVVLRAELGHMLVASILTGIQMSGIGAILTLAPEPLYAAHLTTTWPWGLSPLTDQNLGGVIMWVPGGLLLSVIVLVSVARHLQRLDAAGEAL